MEIRGRPRRSVDYSLIASLGTQSFTGSGQRSAAGVGARVTLNQGGRISLPLLLNWDDYGPFKQYSFQARLVFPF